MTRILPFLLLLLLLIPSLYSQEDNWEDPEDSPEPPSIDSDWYDYDVRLYSRGDRTFNISLGVVFPVLFLEGADEIDTGLTLGGTGTLSYNYFLTSNFFVGGELSGMFSFTRMGNSLFIIPMGARIGYQFNYRRFEFPVSLMAGLAPQLYLETNFLGFIVKPGAAAYWRFNPDWSFGLNGVWWFVPQWPRNGPTVYGNFLELTLSARYHF